MFTEVPDFQDYFMLRNYRHFNEHGPCCIFHSCKYSQFCFHVQNDDAYCHSIFSIFKVNSFVGAFHDAVILYAIALNETLANNGSITNGTEITNRMWNRTFEGKFISNVTTKQNSLHDKMTSRSPTAYSIAQLMVSLFHMSQPNMTISPMVSLFPMSQPNMTISQLMVSLFHMSQPNMTFIICFE